MSGSSAFQPSSRPEPRDANSPRTPVQPAAERANRDMQRLQGLQILLERVAGASIEQLAQKYALPTPEIERKLDDAYRDGALEQLEAQMLTQLGPMVLAVYEAQLKLGSVEAARDIGMSIGLIKKQLATKVTAQPAKLAKPAENLDEFRLQRQTRKYTSRSIDLGESE